MRYHWISRNIFLASIIFVVFIVVRIKAGSSWWDLGEIQFREEDDDYIFGPQALQEFEMAEMEDDDFSCQNFLGFSTEQRKMCQRHMDHMPVIGRALRIGLDECQWQFKDRRWNCTLGNSTSSFDLLSQAGTPEVGFVYAMMSASVVHSVARACREGELKTCGCSNRKRPISLPHDWLWQGCGDNSVYGYKFALSFIDSKEREKTYPRKSKELSRVLMNIHNNEAGRRAVHAYTRPACKCHGVSGSCSIKTCWYQLPSIREIGSRLRERFDSATEVRFSQQGSNLVQRFRRFNRPTKEDIIYTDSPPDYCNPDLRTGSMGTVGRTCNRTSAGMDGCALMCCGRGYYSKKVLIREKCHCKFQWCCFVKCKTCEHILDVHTCK